MIDVMVRNIFVGSIVLMWLFEYWYCLVDLVYLFFCVFLWICVIVWWKCA